MIDQFRCQLKDIHAAIVNDGELEEWYMARYALSLPEQLKQEAEKWTVEQGVSLNRFILPEVAEKVGALSQRSVRRRCSGHASPPRRLEAYSRLPHRRYADEPCWIDTDHGGQAGWA